jgi:hypothetical protein
VTSFEADKLETVIEKMPGARENGVISHLNSEKGSKLTHQFVAKLVFADIVYLVNGLKYLFRGGGGAVKGGQPSFGIDLVPETGRDLATVIVQFTRCNWIFS